MSILKSNNLDTKIAKGIWWTGLATISNQGLRLVVKLVLAKLLLPEDYGVIGMSVVFIGFIEIVSELGMSASLIQRKEKEIGEEHFFTSFWISLTVALFGYLILYFVISPLASAFYNQEILERLIPVLSIPLVLNNLFLIPKVKLSRKLDFKTQTIIEVIAVLLAGITSIILAINNAGVWALAFNGVIISITSAILYFIYCKWIPKFIFDKHAFKQLFSFGGYVLLQRLFNYLTSNIDYIIIGKFVGSAALGVYTLSFILTDTFRKQIMNMLNKVLFPAYSSIQHKTTELAAYYLKVIKVNGLILIPIMTYFIFFAKEIVLIGFGDNWEEAVVPLQILSVGVIIHTISGTVTTVLKSLGHVKLILSVNIYNNLLIAVPAIIVGAIYYGVNGAAIGVLVFKITGLIIYQKHIYRHLHVTFKEMLLQVTSPFLVSIVLASSIKLLLMKFETSLQTLLLSSIIMAILYVFYIYYSYKEFIDIKFKSIIAKTR